MTSLFADLEDALVTILDVATAWTSPLSVERRFELIRQHAEVARALIRDRVAE